MKTLPPQHLTVRDYESLRRDIVALLRGLIFSPVVEVVDDVNASFEKVTKEVRNAGQDAPARLIAALKSGTVQYDNGIFSGQFSHAISSALRAIGARFNTKLGVYEIVDSTLSPEVRAAAFFYRETAKAAHELILRKLDEAYRSVDAYVRDYDLSVDAAADAVEEGFRKAAETLEVVPKLSKESMETFREEYSENLRLFIKKFADGEILTLREEVEQNARAGYRFNRLARVIKEHYQVSEAKADFLARQETALFMSKFRQLQFKEAGVTRYIWRTAHDARVRDAHAHLDGKIFSYDNPPIVDPATGRRRSPGEDYGCRCVDQPVLDPVAVGEDE